MYDLQQNATPVSLEESPAQPATQYCRYCGARIAADAVFCSACGQRLDETRSAPPRQPVRQTYQQPVQQTYRQPPQPVYQQPVYQQQPPQPIIINNVNNNVNTNTNVNANNGYGMGYRKMCNKWTSLLLCLFLGFLGAHKFYEGKAGLGILYLLTFGIGGIGVIIDFLVLLFKPNPYYVR